MHKPTRRITAALACLILEIRSFDGNKSALSLAPAR
jgi:hypothetical protein